MLKKYLAVLLIGMSANALAVIDVYIKNDSNTYDLKLLSQDTQISQYIPSPLDEVSTQTNDNFMAYTSFPGVAEVVDFEYGFTGSGSTPTCHFRFSLIYDYRTGAMMPQMIIAEDKNNRHNDRATCSGKLKGYNVSTGEAIIEFSMNRIKF